MIRYVIANEGHIESFLQLQEQNLLANMQAEHLSGGFVTTPFTVDQLKQLMGDECVFVALDETEAVVAYVVCGSWQFLSAWPIFVHMVSLFDEFTYLGQRMSIHNSYQYGPICIDAKYRGTQILPEIFAFARAQMAMRYPYALTFVNKKNERSYHAHKHKLKLDWVCDFAFGDNAFYMFAFPTQSDQQEVRSA